MASTIETRKDKCGNLGPMSERYVCFKKRKWKSIRVVGLNRIDIVIDGCSIDVHYENLSVENEDIHRCVFLIIMNRSLE